LRYVISTSDQCQSILTSLDHPLKDKFGYALQPIASHLYGITLVTPRDHKVLAGQVYFLICFDPACERYPAKYVPPHSETPLPLTATRLFSHRLKQTEATGYCANDNGRNENDAHAAKQESKGLKIKE